MDKDSETILPTVQPFRCPGKNPDSAMIICFCESVPGVAPAQTLSIQIYIMRIVRNIRWNPLALHRLSMKMD